MTVPGFLSEKIPNRERVTTLFVTEVKIHLFACSLIVLGMEAFFLMQMEPTDLSREFFVPCVIAFFFMLCVLEHLFGLFVAGSAASLISMIPAVLLYLLLKDSETWPYLGIALVVAAVMRAAFVFTPRKEEFLLFGVFVLDAAALYLYFVRQVLSGSYFTDKLLFICLAVLTLSSLQKLLYERNRNAFPFYYFMLVGIILFNLPMSREPIDWTPVVKAGQKIVATVVNAAEDVSYYLSSFFPDTSYTAGYSSLNIKGEKTGESERTQLILRIEEKPYFIFRDEKTEKYMKVRRTLRLAGGLGADREQLVRFLRFLHANGVDRDYASLFSQVSYVDMEYAYIDTADEIAPVSSLLITSGRKKIEGGVSDKIHRKGYRTRACYLEIDYGSPYLIGLLRRNRGKTYDELSYEEAADYMMQVYGTGFRQFINEKEYADVYAKAVNEDFLREFIDTSGTSGRMADLARDLTEGAENEYDKCTLIEEYLRQYKYSVDTVGGHNPKSDMSTSEGMSDIADRFLFETQAGYCVHYTSSMVMLLRLAGIPARAVSGFRYEFPFEMEETYPVSSNCAHTWPEAYLENVGWVPFEPTGAFRTAAEYTWHRKAEVTEESGEKNADADVPELPETADTGEETNIVEEDVSDDTAVRVLRVTWPVVLSIFILFVLLFAGTAMIRNIRYRRGTPEQRLKTDVEMIKRSIRKRSPESFVDRGLLSDYVERAPEEIRDDVQTVFDAYYRSVYGNGSRGISPEENELAKGLREKLSNKQTSVV